MIATRTALRTHHFHHAVGDFGVGEFAQMIDDSLVLLAREERLLEVGVESVDNGLAIALKRLHQLQTAGRVRRKMQGTRDEQTLSLGRVKYFSSNSRHMLQTHQSVREFKWQEHRVPRLAIL